MSKEGGKFVKLQISDGTSPTNFVTVAGQQSTAFQGETETDDITDKSHDGWKSTANVLRGGSVQCSGKAEWPDLTGLDQVRAAWESGADVEAKIIFNSSGGHYRGFWQVTDFQVDGDHNVYTNYNFTLANNGALTWAAA